MTETLPSRPKSNRPAITIHLSVTDAALDALAIYMGVSRSQATTMVLQEILRQPEFCPVMIQTMAKGDNVHDEKAAVEELKRTLFENR